MTAGTGNGGGNGVRSGAHVLSLLAAPLNDLILRALADGPKRQIDLRRAAGSPAQTTLRAHLKGLEAIGAVEKRRHNAFPGALEYELGTPGTELLYVAKVLEHWLAEAPEGPIQLGSEPAKAAVKSLTDAWSTSILRALAARPLSLTELDRVIAGLSYPSLERRLGAMRLANQIEPLPRNGRGTPYTVTGWLRRAVGPIVAASRWERRNAPETTTAIGRIDVEATFLLAVPLLRLPSQLSGACRIAVELPDGAEHRPAGVLAEVEEGRIASCATRLARAPSASASGSLAAWFRAVIEAAPGSLELGGDCRLAQGLAGGLQRALFSPALLAG